MIVLQGIANTISAELNLPAMLRRIAIAALRLTSAQASAVYLVEPGRVSLVVESVETAITAADSGSFGGLDILAFAHPGAANEELFDPDRPRMRLDEGVAGWVASNGMVVLVPYTQADPRFSPGALAADSRILGVHPQSLVAVPLVFNNIVTGVLEVVQTGTGDRPHVQFSSQIASPS